ncbi:MAG: polysaccharide deacetylase family protein [Prolixibacteraceae bacterium]|jgi:peptidoglycan/xylan/chitin deacetylase (PgdA/CDA1 family)|nr:polysaccharide deacetylase family protein [Prolixibacteraceae bacterium]
MIRNICAIIVFILLTMNAFGQEAESNWNDKKCAVVLTYDDGLNVHIDKVVPVLDVANFKATFYIPGNAATLHDRINDWRSIAENGHELGNHTLFHPCAGKSKGREWVDSNFDMDNYSIAEIVAEIKLANTLLYAIDGKTNRTFAYTCGDMSVGDSSFVHLIEPEFIAARGVSSKMESYGQVEQMDIGAYAVNGESADDLIALVNQAMKEEKLLVFLFHGVGGEHSMNIDEKEHNKLINYLKKNEESIWVSSLSNVAEYLDEFKR